MNQENKPLHRHPSLQPLSRHHHHALVMAQKLIRATDDSVESVKAELQTFWQSHGDAHFHEEEAILLPTFAKYADVHREEITQMLLDHVQIRSLVMSLSAAEFPSVDVINQLGERLQQHVRFEERIVFPLIQETVPEAALRTLPDFTVTS